MSTSVLDQLVLAGLYPHCCQGVIVDGHCVRFRLTPEGMARLADDARFASGILHGLHQDVGEDRADYRAHTGSFGPGSLQIVFDRQTGNAYADVDRWSPYADVVGFVGHAFWEVVPNWFRKKRRRDDRHG